MTRYRSLNPLAEIDRRAKKQQSIAYAVGCTDAVILVLLLLGSVSGQLHYFLNLDDRGWVLR